MGLCKCPRQEVTNLFCFEHRVNVCPKCLVKNHPKCIVQSYVYWLQDSDYNPICLLCNKDLAVDDCIRLVCYHVFHWSCLDNYARLLPDTTAPAGYVCPTCKDPIFPKPELVSPVAEALREKISCVNWARAGLGLPLLTEDFVVKPSSEATGVIDHLYAGNGLVIPVSPSPETIVHVEDSSFSRPDDSKIPPALQAPRRPLHVSESSRAPQAPDDDENKYRRRSPTVLLKGWAKSLWNTRYYRGPKRKYVLILFTLVGLFFLYMLTYSVVDINSLENSDNSLHNDIDTVDIHDS